MAADNGVSSLQLYEPEEEKCDSADNDCDGEIDEGNVCTDDVVASCNGIDCPAGEFCQDGACVDACDKVVCTDGETCRGGACFPGCNQCNGIVCHSDESCDLSTGHCISPGANPPGADSGPGGSGGGDC